MITKAWIEVDPSTFVPVVKFEGRFKMEPDIEHPYSAYPDAAECFGAQALEEIAVLLKQKEQTNAHRYHSET